MTDKPGSPANEEDQATAGRLLKSLCGIDVTSADGRAGLTALLMEIEREAPGAIERLAADVQLQKLRRLIPNTAH